MFSLYQIGRLWQRKPKSLRGSGVGSPFCLTKQKGIGPEMVELAAKIAEAISNETIKLV